MRKTFVNIPLASHRMQLGFLFFILFYFWRGRKIKRENRFQGWSGLTSVGGSIELRFNISIDARTTWRFLISELFGKKRKRCDRGMIVMFNNLSSVGTRRIAGFHFQLFLMYFEGVKFFSFWVLLFISDVEQKWKCRKSMALKNLKSANTQLIFCFSEAVRPESSLIKYSARATTKTEIYSLNKLI